MANQYIHRNSTIIIFYNIIFKTNLNFSSGELVIDLKKRKQNEILKIKVFNEILKVNP